MDKCRIDIGRAYARIAGYVAIGLIIFIIVTTVINQRRKAREQQ